MINKSYWLYLEPYVQIIIKRNDGLLFNSLTSRILEYKNKSKIISILKRLNSSRNLHVIKLKKNFLRNNSEISKFVQKIRDNHMGDLIDTDSSGKPIQLMPIVKIQHDAERIKMESSFSVSKFLLINLIEISLYICSECEQNCFFCQNGYKQFLSCYKNNKKIENLDIGKIEKLLQESKTSALSGINILGGDIFRYPKLEQLVNLLNQFLCQKYYYIHYANVKNNEKYLMSLGTNLNNLCILINLPLNKRELEKTLLLLNNNSINSQFIFVIQNEKEFEVAKKNISQLKIEELYIQPYFNGKNLSFFKKNVFLNKKMILASKPTQKEIFSRIIMNPLNFGRIVVLSNGNIHSNVNEQKLGKLGEDSINDIIYKEMCYGKSWRRIRKRFNPCKHCTFSILCPPLSNYEYAIGKNNLCNIMK